MLSNLWDWTIGSLRVFACVIFILLLILPGVLLLFVAGQAAAVYFAVVLIPLRELIASYFPKKDVRSEISDP